MLFDTKPQSDAREQIEKRDPEALILDVPSQPTEALFAQKFEDALYPGQNIKG